MLCWNKPWPGLMPPVGEGDGKAEPSDGEGTLLGLSAPEEGAAAAPPHLKTNIVSLQPHHEVTPDSRGASRRPTPVQRCSRQTSHPEARTEVSTRGHP